MIALPITANVRSWHKADIELALLFALQMSAYDPKQTLCS